MLSKSLCRPVEIPHNTSSTLNIDFLNPLEGCPSHTMSLSITSYVLSPPKILLSAQVSSTVPYYPILSIGMDPFEPIEDTIPKGPTSLM